tara:strand:+ start:533 stop:1072 length:540 start_codon:yes stop_codon:yes gene_type:complete
MAITRIGGANAITGTIPTSVAPGKGKVLQVVQTTKTDAFATTSTSMVDITGFSVSITPSSTSSKILVLVTIGILSNSGAYGAYVNLLRDSTNLISNSDGGNADTKNAWTTGGGSLASDANRQKIAPSIYYLDSPSSTSSLTYKCQMCTDGGSTTAYFNRWGLNNDHAGASTITVMEIGG